MIPIGERNLAAVALNGAFLDQRLERAIDVDRGQPDCVAQLLLRHRQMASATIAQPRSLEPRRKLAEQVRNSLPGVAPSDIDHPLAVDGRVDQRVDPHRFADAGFIENKPLKRDTIDIDCFNMGQRLDVVIGTVKKKMLKIDQVSAHVE